MKTLKFRESLTTCEFHISTQVYDKVFSFSQTAMINYMEKHKEEGESTDSPPRTKPTLNGGLGSAAYKYNPDEGKENLCGAMKNIGDGGEVKAHHLLVLLLRLRQVRVAAIGNFITGVLFSDDKIRGLCTT